MYLTPLYQHRLSSPARACISFASLLLCSVPKQLEALQQARLQEMADHATKVQALKAEVSSIVDRLLSRGCSEADAASALAELGCELLFVDEPGWVAKC